MNKLIFFPSLSAGNSRSWLLKNKEIRPGLSTRFYEKGYPENLYHPYFLLTAGHLFKKMDIRNEMGLNDAFVIGDSGGYQIATGAVKWNMEIREQIFHWLEANSDIAMNLDMPTTFGTFSNRFDDALKISIDNFKYFETNQSGKTKFLTVLQGIGTSLELGKKWYNAVKDFVFNGWAFGGSRYIDRIFYAIALFASEKEFEKKHVKYLHYLAATSPLHLILLAMVQRVLNIYYPDKFQVSTDSSSPNLSSVYGSFYTGINWSDLSLSSMTLGKKHDLNSDANLPCVLQCEVCNGATFNHINKFDEHHYIIVTHHNMAIFTHMLRFINNLMEGTDDSIQEFLSPSLFSAYESLKEMFESDNPIQVYYKYLPIYNKIGSKDIVIGADQDIINEFFEVTP